VCSCPGIKSRIAWAGSAARMMRREINMQILKELEFNLGNIDVYRKEMRKYVSKKFKNHSL
jgi:hypothetical protein